MVDHCQNFFANARQANFLPPADFDKILKSVIKIQNIVKNNGYFSAPRLCFMLTQVVKNWHFDCKMYGASTGERLR